ncbi:MAG: DUF4012 domain-containing protein [Dehalococcoidia bacterium]
MALPRLINGRTIAAVTLIAVLVLAGLAVVRYLRIYGDLSDGRALLVRAAELMEEEDLDIETYQLDEAERKLEAARGKLRRGSDRLDSDPLVWTVGHLPWIGGQVHAAQDLACISVHGTEVGLQAVEAVRRFGTIRDAGVGTLSEKVTPILDAVEPNVAAIEQELAEIQARRNGMGARSLVAPLDSARQTLDHHLAELESRVTDYRRFASVAPKALGYEAPQTYLILAHDNTEILGTGGFILVYGFAVFNEGKLESLAFSTGATIKDWPPTTGEYIEPPRPLKTYLLRDWPMGLAEASWWPDFPTAAQNAIAIYRTTTGSEERIDGVIGVNFLTLEKLLDVVGRVTVEEYEVTVSSEDVVEKALILTHPKEPRAWETGRYQFVGYLAEDVIQRALSSEPSEWASMLSALRSLSKEKNLLLWHRDPEVQGAISDLGYDGGVRPTEADYLMVVDSSLRSTKLNLVVQPAITLDVNIDEEGDARNVVTVNYANDYSAWAERANPDLVRIATGGGKLTLYGNYLRVLVPDGAALEEVTVEGLPVGPEDVWHENGRTVLARYFTLPLDAEREIAFTYAVPSVSDMATNPYTYRLLVQKQPGTRAIPLTITIHPPAGLKIVSTELDGEELEGKPNRIVTDLQEDREVAVRYQPGR